jgi:signal transduction histidine kinase/HAMP domain-containing protein
MIIKPHILLRFRFNLQTKIIGLAIAGALFAGCLVGVIMILNSRKALLDTILENNLTVAEIMADFSANYIDNAQININQFVKRRLLTNAVISHDIKQAEWHLSQMIQLDKRFDSVSLYTTDGIGWASGITDWKNRGGSVADRDWFRQVMKTGKPFLSGPVISRGTGRATLAYGMPIVDDKGTICSVLVAGISLAALSDLLTNLHGNAASKVSLVDVRHGGVIIAHSNPMKILQPVASENPAVQRALAGKHGTMVSRGNNGLELGAFAPVKGVPWSVLIQEPVENAYAPVAKMTNRALIYIPITLLCAALFGFFISRTMTNSIRQLVTGAGEIGKGNLQYRISVKSHDEIGHLASSFNQMAENLRAITASRDELDREVLERRQAEETLSRYTERLKNLHRTDQAILQAVESPEAVVHTVIHHIRSLLQCQRVSVGIFDLEKKEVQVFAADVDGETIVQTGKVLTEEMYGDIDILRQNRIEIMEDISRVASPSATNRILQSEGIRSSINVALVSALEMYGVLNVGWEDIRTITSEDTEIASEVAGQITIAIEKASLLKETNRYAAELEERVRGRTAQLETSNKELEAFSYSVSHDLRAPLRHISGYVELLISRFRSDLSDKGQHYLDSIADSVHQMGLLIDNLLQFSRTGRAEIHRSNTDMNEIVHEIIELLRKDYPDRAIEWTTDNLPPVVCDSAMLRLVWENLLSNAAKFTRIREKALIEVGARIDANEVVYYVRDNGVGFDMQYSQKLFGVFQRLHSTEDFEGTGIGLANVRRIISRHGGRTWAEAESDKGATFYFSIPHN